MINFLRSLTKPSPVVWRRVRVKEISGGFRYRHRDGDIRDAPPGAVVEVDSETFDAVHKKVDVV